MCIRDRCNREPPRAWFLMETMDEPKAMSRGPSPTSEPTNLAWKSDGILASPVPECDSRSKWILKHSRKIQKGTMIKPNILANQ